MRVVDQLKVMLILHRAEAEDDGERNTCVIWCNSAVESVMSSSLSKIISVPLRILSRSQSFRICSTSSVHLLWLILALELLVVIDVELPVKGGKAGQKFTQGIQMDNADGVVTYQGHN